LIFEKGHDKVKWSFLQQDIADKRLLASVVSMRFSVCVGEAWVFV
jgi:hypothetical protein